MGALIHFTTRQRRDICARYESGSTCAEIARNYGVSAPLISRLIRSEGIRPRQAAPRKLLLEDSEREVITMFQNGTAMHKIAKHFNCSTEPIKRILFENGYRPRVVKSGYTAITPEIRAEIISLYKSGVSRRQIWKRVGITTAPIERVIKEEGLPLRDDRNRRGEDCPIYKGRYRNATGYVHCYVPDDSPFVSMRIGVHALEHRLVMAEHLGRPLRPHERVHHKNGVKDDNRIENLEIWEYSHPPGQRVSDKIPHCPTCTCVAH